MAQTDSSTSMRPPEHRHICWSLREMPLPQPHRRAGCHCWCGAVQFDTYPVGPDGADTSTHPIGSAWVEPADVARALEGCRDCDSAPDVRPASA